MDAIEVLHVANIDIDPADTVHCPAGLLYSGFDVLADLSGLRFDIANAGNAAVGQRVVMPEMKTSRPRASIMVAWEKCPLGWRIFSETIWVFGIAPS